jgi:hypothetical protein
VTELFRYRERCGCYVTFSHDPRDNEVWAEVTCATGCKKHDQRKREMPLINAARDAYADATADKAIEKAK